MGVVSTYLSTRFAQHAKPTGGRTYRETLDDTLLRIVYRDLNTNQRVELPLSRIREDVIRADPLLTALSTNDRTYVNATIERYVRDAFSGNAYDGIGGLIDPRVSEHGARHARLIQRLDERLAPEGPLSGARFYRNAFEYAYRGQFSLRQQCDDMRKVERTARSKDELGLKAPVVTLNALFAKPGPLLNWIHDALIDYHAYRFTTEALEMRGHEHLSADSYAHLSDHLARESIRAVLSGFADIVARPLEREIFPGDEVEPLRQ